MWRIAAAGAAVPLGLGLVPPAVAFATLVRVAPVLGFLVAATVLAELAGLARDSVLVLFLLVVVWARLRPLSRASTPQRCS